ncbi:hypothetical protein D3C75_1060530 [compost metagenome]
MNLLILMHCGQEPLHSACSADRIAYGEQLCRSQHPADRCTFQCRTNIADSAKRRNTFKPVNICRLIRCLQQLLHSFKISGGFQFFRHKLSHRGLRILHQFI